MKNLRRLDRYRNLEMQKKFNLKGIRKSLVGMFNIPLNSEESAFAIADNGVLSSEWEHVSVSTPYRCLTWEEMCMIKNLFFHDDEAVIQIHPAKKIMSTCMNIACIYGNLRIKNSPYLHQT